MSDDEEAQLYAEKKAQVEAKLQASILERNAKRQAAREEAEKDKSPEESIAAFARAFGLVKQEVREMMEAVEEMQGEEVVSHMDAVGAKMEEAQQVVNDAVLFLPSYDLRLAQEQITELQQAVTDCRARHMPKPKFSFRARRKQKEEARKKKEASATSTSTSTSSSSDASDSQTASTDSSSNRTDVEKELLGGAFLVTGSQAVVEALGAEEGGYAIVGKGEVWEADAAVVAGMDVMVTRVQEATLVFRCVPTAVRVDRVRQCRLLAGPVDGSVHMQEAQECVFALGVRQMRIHDSHQCLFQLAMKSKPIIEHCDTLVFAPYRVHYADRDSHFAAANQQVDSQLYKDVQDFRWLRSQQSPNWRLAVDTDTEAAEIDLDAQVDAAHVAVGDVWTLPEDDAEDEEY